MTIKNSVVKFTPKTPGAVDGFETTGTEVSKKAYVEKVSQSLLGGEGIPTEANWVILISASDITPLESWLVTEVKIRGKVVVERSMKIQKIFGPISGTYWTYWEIYA